MTIHNTIQYTISYNDNTQWYTMTIHNDIQWQYTMIYNNNTQWNTINNIIQWQYTMMYNNNAQYNTMTIHNVVQYESNVCILYTMPKALCYNAVKKGAHCCKYHYNEIFPRRLDPARAPSSIRCCCRLDKCLPQEPSGIWHMLWIDLAPQTG